MEFNFFGQNFCDDSVIMAECGIISKTSAAIAVVSLIVFQSSLGHCLIFSDRSLYQHIVIFFIVHMISGKIRNLHLPA